jgi:hypothetical protein
LNYIVNVNDFRTNHIIMAVIMNLMLYYTILYYTILYYTILYYTILYYTILYYTILFRHFKIFPTVLRYFISWYFTS